jgi:hypothetical protein
MQTLVLHSSPIPAQYTACKKALSDIVFQSSEQDALNRIMMLVSQRDDIGPEIIKHILSQSLQLGYLPVLLQKYHGDPVVLTHIFDAMPAKDLIRGCIMLRDEYLRDDTNRAYTFLYTYLLPKTLDAETMEHIHELMYYNFDYISLVTTLLQNAIQTHPSSLSHQAAIQAFKKVMSLFPLLDLSQETVALLDRIPPLDYSMSVKPIIFTPRITHALMHYTYAHPELIFRSLSSSQQRFITELASAEQEHKECDQGISASSTSI